MSTSMNLFLSPHVSPVMKGEICVFDIKPYNKDIHNHVQCSAALL